MKWRLVDRVTHVEAWREIAGRKAVSLEEYCLAEPLGRLGVLPETLVLECCVQLAAWLVAASSSFQRTARLASVEGFRLHGEVGMGAVLELSAVVRERAADSLLIACQAAVAGQPVADGAIGCSLVPLGPQAAASSRALWRELHGQA